MDTSKLRKFASFARVALIEQVGTRLKTVLAEQSISRRESPKVVAELESRINELGQQQLLETVAYTWFNRFCALRYMDVNRFTPIGVLSPADGQFQPEILSEAKMGHIDEALVPEAIRKRVMRLLDGSDPSADPQGEAYRSLLVAVCNFYHSLMPFMFEKIADYTELLLPDDLLSEASVPAQVRAAIALDDDSSNPKSKIENPKSLDVELIGWLYQFYIADKKDAVMARKAAVPTDDIPSVTQLFTPHWIVRYLVENSLGRLWLLNHPDSRLRERMPYYIEGETETDFLTISKPEEIRLLDPACGSGHMLTYAYDLLYAIYDEQGYTPTEIPGLILKHNLFGIEICDRAAALAAFALCMKARSSDSRYFRRVVQPNVISLQDVHIADDELEDYVETLGLGDLFDLSMRKLLHQFEDAKNCGSLIQPCLTESQIQSSRNEIQNRKSKIENLNLFVAATHLKVLRVLEQAESLTQRYHVVVANPPYMGNRDMNDRLAVFAKEMFRDSKLDLCTLFMSRSPTLLIEPGLLGLINMQSWMFLSSFQVMRRRFVRDYRFVSMLHLGAHAFDSLQGEVVQTVAFILCSARPGDGKTWFLKLTDGGSEATKEAAALNALATHDSEILFKAAPAEFFDLPGAQFAYALSSAQRHCFSKPSVAQFTEAEGQNKTADNGTYLRLFWEVRAATVGTKSKWRLYAKGGTYRKWHGNIQYLIDWSDTARAHYRRDSRCRIVGPAFLNRIAATWTDISSLGTSFRFLPADATFDMAGPTIFPKQDSQLPFLLGMFNSRPVAEFLPVLNPTLHVQLNDVRSLPTPETVDKNHVGKLVDECCAIARADWDNFETSWDFRDQPLLRPGMKGATLEASWRNWEAHSTAAIRRMQELETENNRLFIAAYGLDGELQPEVPEAQITLARAEARRDMAAFLSYSVGCMMGRYSPDVPGLILANAGDNLADFRSRILDSGMKLEDLAFMPDEDGVVPMLEGEWFEDDVTERFKQFLKATYGTEHFEANVRFVEESLGKSIKKYFLSDFYKDHLQTYKKRPIYWLFSSPKGTFNALIYMHRYRPETVGKVLECLRDFRDKLFHHAEHRQMTADSASASKTEKTQAVKEVAAIKKQLKELEDYEKTLFEVAAKKISIDLDDGVKHNYPLFGTVLRKIPGLDAKED